MTRSTESGRIMLIRKEFAEDGVLIELYWNVNFLFLFSLCSCFRVLIELYWNVNFKIFNTIILLVFVLIELYWNVN